MNPTDQSNDAEPSLYPVCKSFPIHSSPVAALCLHLTLFASSRGDVSTIPAVTVALHAFLLECEWTDMTKASPRSPPAQCVVSSITSPVPHATVVTFTGEQADGEVQTSVVSGSPQLPLVLPRTPRAFGAGLSCLEHTSSYCNSTSTLPSPAHEPERMSNRSTRHCRGRHLRRHKLRLATSLRKS